MKSLIFSLMFMLATLSANGAERDSVSIADSLLYLDVAPTENVRIENAVMTKYDRRIHRHREHWAELIPTQFILQYAGNMGVMSVGIGWDYGKHKQWETNLLFGYLPKISSHRGKLTMTIKENFLPWSMYMKGGWLFEPLNTKVRINAFVGQRVTKIVPANKRKFLKSVSAFYEVSTCDLYVRLLVMEKKVSLWDILCLSVGVKMQIL